MSRLYTMVWVFLAALVGHGALAETITHERTTAKDSVAVCVEGDVAAADLAVTVNGTAIEQTPYETKEGLWYQIGSGALVVGTNTITVEQLNGAPAAITLRVRELTSGAEEAHFPLVVGPVTQAQPAVDANQLLMDVQHVDLDLTLDPTASVFTAAVMTMTAESLDNSLSQCVLDLNDNGGALVVSAVDDGFGSGLTFTHNGAQDRLFITLPAAVPSGNTFTVRVFYSGDPLVSGNRGYQRGTHSGNPVLYTHNQPYARTSRRTNSRSTCTSRCRRHCTAVSSCIRSATARSPRWTTMAGRRRITGARVTTSRRSTSRSRAQTIRSPRASTRRWTR
jgi:hypothetical protein